MESIVTLNWSRRVTFIIRVVDHQCCNHQSLKHFNKVDQQQIAVKATCELTVNITVQDEGAKEKVNQ